jgi:hypothetical protein
MLNIEICFIYVFLAPTFLKFYNISFLNSFKTLANYIFLWSLRIMVKFDSADHALRLYKSEIVKVLYYGSTSIIGRFREGIILKSPRYF